MISGVEKRKWPRDGWRTLPIFSLTPPLPWMAWPGHQRRTADLCMKIAEEMDFSRKKGYRFID
jgi:hypothetical protein